MTLAETPPFERVAVLGLGLLGGSVALAARAHGAALRVVAAGRRRAPLEQALREGVVDEVGEIAEVVRGADLVVLGSPVGSMPRIVQEAAPHLDSGALVTDVGSVKAALCDSLPGLLPRSVSYVGAHPMAGSHLRGVGHARADLFAGACCVLTPLADTPAAARERVAGFWSALGARVVVRSAAEHDAQVAWMSHVPHVLAFAFGDALSKAQPGAAELAGSGFRDFTRIARSDAELWGEILSANRKALARPLQAFRDALARLVQAIEDGDTDAVEECLASSRQALSEVEIPERAPGHGPRAALSRPIRGRNPGNSGGPARSASPKKVNNDT